MRAAAQQPESIALPVIVFLAISGGVIYLFGYARAVLHRANADYKSTKAAVPKLRKGFWVAWFRALKVALWIIAGIVILGFWAYGDITEHRPAPASTVAPTRSAK